MFFSKMEFSVLLVGIVLIVLGIVFTVTFNGSPIWVPMIIVGVIIFIVGLLWPKRPKP